MQWQKSFLSVRIWKSSVWPLSYPQIKPFRVGQQRSGIFESTEEKKLEKIGEEYSEGKSPWFETGASSKVGQAGKRHPLKDLGKGVRNRNSARGAFQRIRGYREAAWCTCRT